MIYFDNSATTKIHPEALTTYQKVSTDFFGNPSSLHALGVKAQQLLEQARQQFADLLGTAANEIYFTGSGTEGDNWVIKGTAHAKRRFGKHIITTSGEHPAVSRTMDQLEADGFEVTRLKLDESGRISVRQLEEALRPDTILVSVIAVNNEMGAIQPLQEIGEVLADFPNIHYHVDAVQALGKIELPLGAGSRIDAAVFSAHKFHGPRGVGLVYLKEGRVLEPLLVGGGQEHGSRSGTENLPGIVAAGRACRLLFEDRQQKTKKLKQLTAQLRSGLEEYPLVHLFSDGAGAPHITCLGIEGIRGEVTVHALEEEDIYVSTTSACSSRSEASSSTLLAMGIPPRLAETAIRISFSDENEPAEVERFLEVFDDVYQRLTRIHQ